MNNQDACDPMIHEALEEAAYKITSWKKREKGSNSERNA